MSAENSAIIITMDDMAAVFAVTDACGIHRESVSVELAREDPGAVAVDDRGQVAITLPASRAPADYAGVIRQELEARGYAYHPGRAAAGENGGGNGRDVAAGDDNGDDDGDDDWLGGPAGS